MKEKRLNAAQRRAIDTTSGKLLIVAGAGTGKTTVITEKIASLTERGLATPEQIVALTFTDKAAIEMQERIEDRLNLPYSDMQISTFHAFCQKILGQYGLDIGLPNTFELLTETNAWLLLRKHIYDFDLHYYRPIGNPMRHVHEFLKHFSRCKDELIDPLTYLEYAQNVVLDNDKAGDEEKNRLLEVAQAYHQYNQLLLKKGYLDFGDLIFYVVKLFQERPNVLKRVQQQYPYILVDEFQDVNYAQYVLTELLSREGHLTVVGDDDQSIYAFRGSSVENILRFQEKNPEAKSIVLNENYRSAQVILDQAYRSIQNNNPNRLEVRLNIKKRLESQTTWPDAGVVHFHAYHLDEEVKLVLAELVRLKEQHTDATWDDFAILVRANNHAEPFLQGLEKAHIPYEFLASEGLFRQPLILDTLSYMKVINDVSDSVALYRLLRLPVLNFPQEDLQKFTFTAKKKSLTYYELLKRASEFSFSEPALECMQTLLQVIEQGILEAPKEKPTVALYRFLERSGVLLYLTKEEDAGNQTIIHQIYQLHEFFEMVREYEETIPDAHLQGFLEQYEYTVESGDEGKLFQSVDTPDSVNVLTVHASKGLEFRFVFIVNLVEERFPTRRRSDPLQIPKDLMKQTVREEDFHLQEERRLFYVAMTRAKERLYFTSASDYGGVRKKKLSRFLSELGYTDEGNTKVGQQLLISDLSIPVQEALNLEKQLPSPPHAFSFSQIKSYQTCPYQYKLAHILKLPTKSNASLSFGTSIHTTLQKFYERVQVLNASSQGNLFEISEGDQSLVEDTPVRVPSLEELLQIYEENFIDDWYQDRHQKKKFFQQGKEVLTLFYRSEEGRWNVPAALESPFKIKVGNFWIRGRIDRIDKIARDNLEIIDYKTGKSKEKLTLEDKEQLLIYQIAAQTLPQYRQMGSVEKLTFYYINDNIQTSFLGGEKELEKLYEKLTGVIEQIHQGNFSATPNPFACKNCDFRDICQYRSL